MKEITWIWRIKEFEKVYFIKVMVIAALKNRKKGEMLIWVLYSAFKDIEI